MTLFSPQALKTPMQLERERLDSLVVREMGRQDVFDELTKFFRGRNPALKSLNAKQRETILEELRIRLRVSKPEDRII
jgi:hypothetical protein